LIHDDHLKILRMNLSNQKPLNSCRECGGTSYHHVVARNEQGELRATQALVCDGCGRLSPDVQTWRNGVSEGEAEQPA
jgi:hypothetical protein